MSELSLLWDGPNPIGQTNLSQPEYRILRIMPRQEITNYNTRKLGKSGLSVQEYIASSQLATTAPCSWTL